MSRIAISTSLVAFTIASAPSFLGAADVASQTSPSKRASRSAPASRAVEPLSWPTDSGTCVTSSFCEFRPDHFHSGIDISTWGKVGYRCFAVADGEIVRARISCGGYGRALYLRLEDGRTAVYAHLSRFFGPLADTLRAQQLLSGTAYLDREFPRGSFPVRRGEVIGFTGQSGVGIPHLHFELRDRYERPLDPLAEGLSVSDSTPPAILRVALTPLDFASSVNGLSDTVLLEVERNGQRVRGGPVAVEGSIGIAVEIDESIDDCRRRLAPRRLELWEARELLYAIEYDRFSFSETGRIDLQIDPRFSYSKLGRFHNLWRRKGNSLFSASVVGVDGNGVVSAGGIARENWSESLEAGGEGAGYVPLHSSVQTEGEVTRELTVVVRDVGGNEGRADITLSFAPPPILSVLAARLTRSRVALEESDAALDEKWADTLEVDVAVKAPGRKLSEIEMEYSLDAGASWHSVPSLSPGSVRTFATRIPVLGRIPGTGRGGTLVRARALDVLGAASLPRTVGVEGATPPPETSLPVEATTLGSWVELRFPPSTLWSALFGGWDEGIPVLVRPWGKGVRIVREPGESEGVHEWSGSGKPWRGFDPWGRPVALVFEMPRRLSGAREGGQVASPYANYRFPPGCFAEDVAVKVREEAPPTPEKELRPLGPLHFLETGQVPLTSAFTITLVAEESVEFDAERVGIFVQEPDRFRYIGGERERDGAGWSGRARTPLGIGLFEDAVPPVLGEPRLEIRLDEVRLSFSADDQGSGIDCNDVEVLFDGQPVLHELDDETGEVVAYPALPGESGAGGSFELRAVDRVGNSARRVVTVRLP